MTHEITLYHAAVPCDTPAHAKIFFENILGLKLVKSFSLDHRLSKEIFSLPQSVEISVYGNDSLMIEVFIHPQKTTATYAHLCLGVGNSELFIEKCESNGLKPFYVTKGEKQLLFVHDFSGNLYEIKE
jgi:catechol 2,3-dioxygenase-like lactoylglutathione lyase family enzyme